MLELVSVNIIVLISLITLYSIRKVQSLKSFRNNYLAIILLILAGSVFILNKSLDEINDFLDRREWPLIAGEITTLDIKGDKTREPIIKYKYVLDGKFYHGQSSFDTPLFGGTKSQQRVSMAILNEYSVGDTVIVHFNPNDYSKSVLKVTPYWSSFIQYSLALLLSAFMAALIINRMFRTLGKIKN